MARISKDKRSWHARSIIRRDARHDLEHLSDEASTGKVRRSKRRAVKRCEHKFPPQPQNQRYGEVRCVHCGKGKWFYNPNAGFGFDSWWRRPKQDPTKVYSTGEAFFPVHDEGTCATCDERREAQAR